MSVKIACYVTASITVATLMVCFMTMSTIYSEVDGFREQLDTEMNVFRVSIQIR